MRKRHARPATTSSTPISTWPRTLAWTAPAGSSSIVDLRRYPGLAEKLGPGEHQVTLSGPMNSSPRNHGSIATTIDAMKLGAVYYLQKPADADDILAAFHGKREGKAMVRNYRKDGSEFPIEMVLWRTSVHDSIFYCVANMPGAVPNTSTYALTNATLPYTVALADKGWQRACREDAHLKAGLNVHAGRLTCAAVGESLGVIARPCIVCFVQHGESLRNAPVPRGRDLGQAWR